MVCGDQQRTEAQSRQPIDHGAAIPAATPATGACTAGRSATEAVGQPGRRPRARGPRARERRGGGEAGRTERPPSDRGRHRKAARNPATKQAPRRASDQDADAAARRTAEAGTTAAQRQEADAAARRASDGAAEAAARCASDRADGAGTTAGLPGGWVSGAGQMGRPAAGVAPWTCWRSPGPVVTGVQPVRSTGRPRRTAPPRSAGTPAGSATRRARPGRRPRRRRSGHTARGRTSAGPGS